MTPSSTCETCSAPVERVFHPVAVHFKGSGFYNTDYGTRRRSRELKEAGEGSSKKDDSSSKKSDSDSKSSKPESKTSSSSPKSD